MPTIPPAAVRPALDPIEVDRRVHALLDQDGSGRLDRDEWVASGRGEAAFQAAVRGDDGRLGPEAFHALRVAERAAEAARGGRGGWTLEEFRAVSVSPGLLRAERGMPIGKRHQRAFEARDTDRDGRLSPDEWARPVAPRRGWWAALLGLRG